MTFDLVVIGAGIHGAAAALEASRRGLGVLIIERGDFGGETSWNSLRVLHGGLRYLQTLDLVRFRESIRARSWYTREFPTLIEPLECLMPLYGQGARRTGVLRPVLAGNELLRRLWSSPAEIRRIPAGSVVTSDAVKQRFPGVRSTGLRGGAVWFDGYLPQPQRVLIEMLRRASRFGTVALNYAEATGWTVEDGRVSGVNVHDRLTDKQLTVRTRAVLNCAGPWAADLDGSATPATHVPFAPTLAFNVLLDKRLASDVTVAVEPASGGRTFFLHPHGDVTMAGTYHVRAETPDSLPTEENVLSFLRELSEAIPGFDLAREDVLRIMPGTVPAAQVDSDKPATRDVWVDHGSQGGPGGLFTLIGTKYTTAPLAAKRAIDRIMGRSFSRFVGRPAGSHVEPETRSVPHWGEFKRLGSEDSVAAAQLVCSMIEGESVTSMDDLLFRRTDWGLIPAEYERAAELVTRLCPDHASFWDAA